MGQLPHGPQCTGHRLVRSARSVAKRVVRELAVEVACSIVSRYPRAVSTDRDDELGQTATAHVEANATPPPLAAPLGSVLGRYRLERELGAGGMGVVHAAFDPDLERRVALKVLRSAGTNEAQKRLLREARAMARLAHPNVVTVHEVGSVNGRDYVAMELIDGETLAEWLRAEERDPRAITEAFLAAGRGLAAAHAAGVVHRDFKPHNVLRSRAGRIVVTDFGLARDATPDDAMPDPLATTLPVPGDAATATGTPSSLAGLTMTGSVLGTPAYMAPEQWNGGAVTPATDQFGFCVAMWEALSGERPYRGPTVDDLRAQVAAGPDALDASQIPRRLRAILRRGLDPDPAKRWSSMDQLLGRLARTERRTGIAIAIATGGLVAAGVLMFAMRGSGVPAEATCELPKLDPGIAWSPEVQAQVRAKASGVETLLDGDVGRWRAARSKACTVEPVLRARQLACLDGVMARLDAVRQAALRDPSPPIADAVAGQLIEPSVCAVADPPRLTTRFSPASIVGLALQRTPVSAPAYDEAAEAAAMRDVADDPCGRAQLELARAQYGKTARARQAVDEARQAAELCGDERIFAEAVKIGLSYRVTRYLDSKVPSMVHTVERAVERVSQPDLRASLDLLKGRVAQSTQVPSVALGLFDAAINGFAGRRPRAVLVAALAKNQLLVMRGQPGDLETARTEVAKWRAAAVVEGDTRMVDSFDRVDGELMWMRGEVAGANAKLNKVGPDPMFRDPRPMHSVSGTVVDRNGKPVAGAKVAGGTVIAADSMSVSSAVGMDGRVSSTTTDAAGRFTLDRVPEDVTIVAELGTQRSLPISPATNGARLILAPTGRIAGRVELGAPVDGQTVVVAYSALKGVTSQYQIAAPITDGGRFELDRLPRGPIKIGVARHGVTSGTRFNATIVDVTDKPIAGLVLRAASGAPLRVLVRSTTSMPVAGAIVFVAPDKVAIRNLGDLDRLLKSSTGVGIESARPVIGEPPPEIASQVHPGDVFAVFVDAPVTGTICAVGLQGDLSDPASVDRINMHSDDAEARCQPLTADARVIAIEVPPMKRTD
jgi:predicted Ser/Thr protein kinase